MIKLKYPDFWSKRNWLSFIMIPFSYIYIFLGFLRTKNTKEIRLSQKVICVGNITLGGAGKTQIVAWLAQVLREKNISFVIITKAYRSDLKSAKLVEKTDTAKEVGDESVILREFGSIIATKRIKDSVPLINQINPEIVILDDGMQNPVLKKDLQILAIDSSTAIGNNRIFPAGPLRETLGNGLAKSDLIFMIGNNQCKDFSLINNINLSQKPYFKASIRLREDLDKNNRPLSKLATKEQVLGAYGTQNRSMLNSSTGATTQLPLEVEFGKKSIEYIAFAGIGNPEKFYSLLSQNNFKVKQCISFEDHHNYSDNDIKKLVNLAKLNNCCLITTEKDYVKLANKYKDFVTCVRVNLQFENEKKCIDLIYEKILQKN